MPARSLLVTLKIVPRAAVERVITHELAFNAVHRAFVECWSGKAVNFPVVAGRGRMKDSAVNLKLGHDGRSVGFKVGTYWPGNETAGLPNHGATTLLLDPATGLPLALLEASLLNRFRTAAADAVATDALARSDARVLAIIGTGRQSEYEVRAVAAVRGLSEIRIGGRSPSSAQALAERLKDLGLPLRCCGAEDAVRGADIVICATSAVSPALQEEWVSEGTHISAMGADRAGKQELPEELFRGARVFVDDPPQAVSIGECQHAVRAGILEPSRLVPIGAVLAGAASGRKTPRDLTIFDSSGVAAQDLAVASDVLELADALGLVEILSL